MTPEVITVAAECRASDDGPMLHGVILQEGRAATGGRAEVFAPGSVVWPASGVEVLTEHRGAAVATAVPTREANGEIRIALPAGPALFAAYQAGKRMLSVEFHSLSEARTAGGVRELRRALVDRVALVRAGEYDQARAEIRSPRRKVYL